MILISGRHTLTTKARSALIALLLLLAAAGRADAAPDYSAIHTVSVISSIGDKVNLSFGNMWGTATKEMPIQSWNIDALVETRLRQYLSGRFTFKDILYDRSALAKIPNTPFSFSNTEYSEFLKSIPANGVDAYIIVRPDLEYHQPGVAGLGLWNADNFAKPMTPYVWTNYEIDIVDARTLQTIAHAISSFRRNDKSPFSWAGVPSPALRVGGDFKLTDAQINLLHATVVPMVNLSLIEVLRDLNTGVALPPPGARTIVPVSPERDPYKAYKKVAIVSALGDVIDLEHEGGTIFSHDNYLTPDPNWHLDDLVEARARAALEKHFLIAQPNVDRATFANAMIWDRDGKLAPNFAGLNPSPDVDLYVVFLKLKPAHMGRGQDGGRRRFQ